MPVPPVRPAFLSRSRRAFTLAEMLVVIGIILLILAISVPAFSVFLASRSVESARNVIAASIVRARSEAIRRGQPCGVFFYVDPVSGRSGVAVVTLDPLTDPDPYDEYKAYYGGAPGGPIEDYQGGTYDPLGPDVVDEPAMTADRVVTVGQDANPTYTGKYAAFAGRPLVLTLQHTGEEVPNNPGLLPAGGGDDQNPPQPTVVNPGRSDDTTTFENNFWVFQGVGSLELIDGIQPELLAPRAGVQMILGQILDGDVGLDGAMDDTDTTRPPVFRERYTRCGAIIFDSEGRLMQTAYGISGGSRLARVIGLDPDGANLNPQRPDRIPPTYAVTPAPLPTSQLGIVIYELDAFESGAGDGTALEWQGSFLDSVNTPTAINDFIPSNGDFELPWNYYNPLLGGDPRANEDEYAEERWLDANTTPLMVNRYSGTLVEAE